jgi:hypothetical protein
MNTTEYQKGTTSAFYIHYLFFVDLGFELSSLCLQSKESTTRAIIPVHISLEMWQMRSHEPLAH